MTATQLLEVIASFSMQVLTVILACSLLERVVSRTSERCALWSMCFFCVLFLAAASMLIPRLHLIQPWSSLPPRTLLTFSAAQSVIGRSVIAVWSIGVAVSLIRWGLRSYRLRRLLRRCERMKTDDIRKRFNLQPLGGGHHIQVLISDNIDGPFCLQLHHPMIVLPRYLHEGNAGDLTNVVVHELEHLKTNHPFQLFVQNVAQVICWFHPAMWRAGERASLLREFMCDEAAAANGASSAAYLRTLLRIAERCESKSCVSAINFGRSPSEIVLRARRLVELAKRPVQHHRGLMRYIPPRVALACLTLGLCLVCIPCDPLTSSRSMWSPWPSWSAGALHPFGMALRDYEQYDPQRQIHELAEAGGALDQLYRPEPPLNR